MSRALTLQDDKGLFILELSEPAKAAVGKPVTVVDYPDGRLAIRYCGVEPAYHTFDKLPQVEQGVIADNKRLGAVLAMIREQQLRGEPERRSDGAARRRDQHNARHFKVDLRFLTSRANAVCAFERLSSKGKLALALCVPPSLRLPEEWGFDRGAFR